MLAGGYLMMRQRKQAIGVTSLFKGQNLTKGNWSLETGKWAHALEYTGPDITELTLATWVSLDSYAKTAGSALTLDKVSAESVLRDRLG